MILLQEKIDTYTEQYFIDLLQIDNDIKISFNQITNSNDIKNIILNIINAEFKNYTNSNKLKYYNLDIKNLDFQSKKDIFNLILKSYNIVNPYCILNIVSLIRAYNDFSDDFFKLDNIYFNDITEFLDIKLDLKDELDCFITEFSKWYFSLFKSLHKMEFNFLDDVKKIPVIFEKIIVSSDLITLSGIISKSKISEINELYLVENALFYITSLSQKMNIASTLFSQIKT